MHTRRTFLKGLGAAVTAFAFGDRFARADSAPSLVQFWDMRYGPPSVYADTARKIVGNYNAATPKVFVSYEMQEWSDWPEVFSMALGSGIGPDVSTGGAYQAVQYYEQGSVAHLDDLIAEFKASGDDKDFLPGALDQMVYKGHTVALPWAIDPRVIFYRKDLFEKAGVKPPNSWDELRAAAKAVTADGSSGLVIGTTEVVGGHSLLLLFMNNGGGLFAADGTLDVMNARNVEAATFLSNLAKDGSIHPGSPKIGGDAARKEFLAGRAAMIIDAAGLQASFQEQRDKIGVLPPPTGPHGDKGTVAWMPNMMLYSHCKEPEIAKEFMKWWLGNQEPLWTDGHCTRLPVRTSLMKNAYFQNDSILKEIVDEWVPIGRGLGTHSTGLFPFLNTLDGFGPMQTLARDLLNGKDVEQSLHLAEARIKSLMAHKEF